MHNITMNAELAAERIRAAITDLAAAIGQLAVAHIDTFDYKLSGALSTLSDVHLDLTVILAPDADDAQPELA